MRKENILSFCFSVIRVVFIAFCVSLVCLYLLEQIPGTSQDVLQGLEANSTSITLKQPSKPFVEKYIQWFVNAIRGNLGTSSLTGEKVAQILIERARVSFILAIMSFVPAFILAILWVYILDNTKKFVHKSLQGILIFTMSFTPLTLAIAVIMLITIFNIPIPIFYGKTWLRYVVPIVVLIIVQIPLYVQSLLSSVKIVKKRSFVIFAKGLGFSNIWIWWREILPNALLFTTELAALQLGALLSGTVLIEYIFSLSGLGNALIYSVYSRDVMVIQAIVLLSAILIAIMREIAKNLGKIAFDV